MLIQKLMIKTFFFFVTFLVYTNGQAALNQGLYNIKVKGNVKCAEYPAAAVHVRLWKNNEKALLNESFADTKGNFYLSSTISNSNFKPILGIYHDCNDGAKAGLRKAKFQIPGHYISHGENNDNIFDLGEFNLETVLKYNEERIDHVDKKRRRRTLHKSPRVHNNLSDLENEKNAATENSSNRKRPSKNRFRRYEDRKRSRSDTISSTTVRSNVFGGKYEEPDDRNDPW